MELKGGKQALVRGDIDRAIAWTRLGAPNVLHTAPTGRGNQPNRFPRAALRLPGANFTPSLRDERPPLAGRRIETASSNCRFRSCDWPAVGCDCESFPIPIQSNWKIVGKVCL